MLNVYVQLSEKVPLYDLVVPPRTCIHERVGKTDLVVREEVAVLLC